MGDRLALTEFWEKQAHSPTIETMMLNVLAQKIDLRDKQDVLEALPNFEGMRIVELGAGIGRITPILAAKAEHVTAVDIVESFVETNRKNHGHMGNITFESCEASAIKVMPNSIDLVFTNWLLMYLTDTEMINLMKSALRWLNVGGYFHIRESCSESSKRTFASNAPDAPADLETNPTHYRHISQYLEVLKAVGIRDNQQGANYRFEILWAKSVDTYVEMYGNWRQVQMLVIKAISSGVCGDQNCTLEATEDACHLLKVINNTSVEQTASDKFNEMKEQLFGQQSPTTHFLLSAISQSKEKVRWVLNVTLDEKLDVCPFELAKGLDARVSDLEGCFYTYNWKLAKAVAKQDKRIRLFWADIHHPSKLVLFKARIRRGDPITSDRLHRPITENN